MDDVLVTEAERPFPMIAGRGEELIEASDEHVKASP
jgi:hypothetical protein